MGLRPSARRDRLLNRRSRKHRMNGWRFYRLLEFYHVSVPPHHRAKSTTESRVGIMRSSLTAEASITEEPGPVVPHTGICTGAVG